MNPLALVAKLIELGIELQAADGEIRYRPIDVIPPDLAAAMKKHKADLLDLIPRLSGGTCPRCGRPQFVGPITGVVRCTEPLCELEVTGGDTLSSHARRGNGEPGTMAGSCSVDAGVQVQFKQNRGGCDDVPKNPKSVRREARGARGAGQDRGVGGGAARVGGRDQA